MKCLKCRLTDKVCVRDKDAGPCQWCISTVNIDMITFCASSEQHAVDELLQLAVKGVDIDGQVLAYLELAQVCPQ